MKARVRSVRWEAQDILGFRLEPLPGAHLAPFTAGAHVDVADLHLDLGGDAARLRIDRERVEVLLDHAAAPLLTKRKAGIEQLARAYAERAFRPDDPDALGVTGSGPARFHSDGSSHSVLK